MSTLKIMLDVFGDRNISISREISKKFETVYRGKISEVIDIVPEKGEFVIVVEGSINNSNDFSDMSVRDAVDMYIKAGLDVMSAIKRVAKDRGVSKSIIYKEYHSEV